MKANLYGWTVSLSAIWKSSTAMQAKDGVSLVEVLDQTSSPMGARLLRQWLAMPIIDRAALNERYDIVEYFIHNEDILEQLRGLIGEVGDLERILSETATGRIIPREMVQLGRSLRQMQPIKDLCSGTEGRQEKWKRAQKQNRRWRRRKRK